MKFAIFSASEPQELADMCIATIKHHHPDADILHMTDEETDALAGANHVRRLPRQPGENIILLRCRHWIAMGDEPFVSVDTDTIVRGPMDEVFDQDFDVALCARSGWKRYNAGVVFSRCGAFWQEVYHQCLESDDKNLFNVVEKILPQVVDSGKWNVLELPCETWNCFDFNMQDREAAKVYHFKGGGKSGMKNYYDSGAWR